MFRTSKSAASAVPVVSVLNGNVTFSDQLNGNPELKPALLMGPAGALERREMRLPTESMLTCGALSSRGDLLLCGGATSLTAVNVFSGTCTISVPLPVELPSKTVALSIVTLPPS